MADDSTFPGAKTAMDPQAVKELFQRTLTLSDDLEITNVKVLKTRLVPRESLILHYQVQLKNTRTGRVSNPSVLGRLLKPDEEPVFPDPAYLRKFEDLPRNKILTPTAYLPEPRMMVHTFPVDPGLPWLLEAFDPAVMKRELNSIGEQQPVQIEKVSTRLLQYHFGARATIQYTLAAQRQEGDSDEPRRLVGKVQHYTNLGLSFAKAWALYQATADQDVNIPRPVAILGHLNLILQEHVPGKPLYFTTDLADLTKVMPRVARGLAAIHNAQVPFTRWYIPGRRDQLVRQRLELATGFESKLNHEVTWLYERLLAEIGNQVEFGGPVHGDFHPGNVLVEGDQVSLIDLDQTSHGDPLFELGNFLSNLRRVALAQTGSVNGYDGAIQAFLDEYFSLVKSDESRLKLIESFCLLRTATIKLGSSPALIGNDRAQEEEKRSQVEALLVMADRLFGEARPNWASVAIKEVAPPPQPPLDQKLWTNDTVYVGASLHAPLFDSDGVRVNRCWVESDEEIDLGHRLVYRVSGRKDDRDWSGVLEGIAFKPRESTKKAGYDRFKHLQEIWPSLADDPRGPRLPRPVAYIDPLAMAIVEPLPQAKNFASLLGAHESVDAARRIGQALAALHQTPVKPNYAKSIAAEITQVEHQVRELELGRPDLAPVIQRLLEVLTPRLQNLPDRVVPALGCLTPENISIHDNRIGFDDWSVLGYSRVLGDLSDLLARLAIKSCLPGLNGDLRPIAATLREAYCAAAAISPEAVGPGEALALLRLCQADPLAPAEEILEIAAARLTLDWPLAEAS